MIDDAQNHEREELCGMCNIQHDRQFTHKHNSEVRSQTAVAVEKQ
jgi:hypothetical protein